VGARPRVGRAPAGCGGQRTAEGAPAWGLRVCLMEAPSPMPPRCPLAVHPPRGPAGQSDPCSGSFSQVPKGVCVLEHAEYQVSPAGRGERCGGAEGLWGQGPGQAHGQARQTLGGVLEEGRRRVGPPHRPSLCPKPGSPVYSSKCQNCVCTDRRDNATQLNVIACTHVPCNTTCSPVSSPAPAHWARPPHATPRRTGPAHLTPRPGALGPPTSPPAALLLPMPTPRCPVGL